MKCKLPARNRNSDEHPPWAPTLPLIHMILALSYWPMGLATAACRPSAIEAAPAANGKPAGTGRGVQSEPVSRAGLASPPRIRPPMRLTARWLSQGRPRGGAHRGRAWRWKSGQRWWLGNRVSLCPGQHIFCIGRKIGKSWRRNRRWRRGMNIAYTALCVAKISHFATSTLSTHCSNRDSEIASILPDVLYHPTMRSFGSTVPSPTTIR
jgi:hypothetical protein